jgi:hypothetical protein
MYMRVYYTHGGFIMPINVKREKLSVREKTGERVADKDTYADRYAPAYADEHTPAINDEYLPTCIKEKDVAPEIPIPDKRVEMFLNEIVERNISNTAGYYDAFKKHITPITGCAEIDKSNMRTMMMSSRVRERLKFLRDAEWELNRPNIQGIARQFEYLIESEDIKASDKITALNSLAKIAGLLEQKQDSGKGHITVTFNMQEMPKMEQVIDVTPKQ